MLTLSKIAEIEAASLRTDLPVFRVGDTVAVHYKIVEGDKLRVQVFRGIVIQKHRAGARSTFTVREGRRSPSAPVLPPRPQGQGCPRR
jgi:large subunit ribosomal protein L19